MRKLLRHPIFDNWFLKIFSLGLATVLWATVASEPTSEIEVSLPLEYQNVPEDSEIVGDTTNIVEVRLRGPSSLLKKSLPDVSVSIDLSQMKPDEERIVPLTAAQVRVPSEIEVVRIVPARVRLAIEKTISRGVPLQPRFSGSPAEGYEIESVAITPSAVQVEGPQSHVLAMETLPTVMIDVSGKESDFVRTVDLDVPDPVVRVASAGPVQIEVRIRRR